MLLKETIGIEGGAGVDHFLISDLFHLASSATLRLSGFTLSRLAISAGRRFQLRNFRSCFQLFPDSANSLVIDLGGRGNRTIALGWVGLQQLRYDLSTILSTEVATMDVGA